MEKYRDFEETNESDEYKECILNNMDPAYEHPLAYEAWLRMYFGF